MPEIQNAVALVLVRDTPDLVCAMRKQIPGVRVVDNGSKTPIVAAWFRLPVNRYFSGGWNAAIRAMEPSVQWAWLLNSDVSRVSPDMMVRLVALAEERGAVMVSPGVQTSAHANMRTRSILESPFVDCVAPLVSVEWFRNSGGFDEAMPGWGSDIDLCYRTQADKKLIVGTEQVDHPYEVTSRRLKDRTMYQVTPTRRHLIEKHGEAIKDFCPMYFGTGREPDKKPENQGGNTMRIIKRPNIGRGLHRSGWVDAMAAIERVATPAGVLLDDCVEYTFLFGGGNPKPHNEPWVGMFHFPAEFDSPFPQDAANNSAKTLLKNRVFLDSLDSMVGGIALSTPLAAWWQERTGKPFITIKHPTATAVPQWSLEAFQQRPLMLQLGWHLRNTRAIHHQPPIAGWQYARIACYQDYQRKRDQSLQRALGSEPNANVEEWPRLPNDRYDATLASCVAISEAFGMAACNVVVECIARGTPLLTRRCPESVEYLGADYPLYLDDLPMLDSAALLAAHHAMIAARGTWLACSAFASDVAAFCSQFKSNAQNTQQSQYKSNAAEARPQLRNAIAKYLGVSREHASGVVSNWSEERISRTHRAMSEAPIADRVALLAGSVRDQHTPP